MKKAIILYIAYFTLSVIIQGCCGNIVCIDYVDVKGGTLRVNVNGIFQQTGNYSVTGDTIRIELDFLREFIARQERPISLMGTAYATTCQQCVNGERGLKDKVIRITLTGNQPYQGVSAGSPLNSFFKTKESDNDYSNIPRLTSLDSLGYLMNNFGSRVVRPFYIFSGTKPGNLLPHQLNLKLEFESGKVINALSPDFTWN